MSAGTAIALACAAYSLFGVSHSARRDYVYNASEAAIFGALQPLMWSFALCWLVYCCATNQTPGSTLYDYFFSVLLSEIKAVEIKVGGAIQKI